MVYGPGPSELLHMFIYAGNALLAENLIFLGSVGGDLGRGHPHIRSYSSWFKALGKSLFF